MECQNSGNSEPNGQLGSVTDQSTNKVDLVSQCNRFRLIHEASNFHGLLSIGFATDRNQIQKLVTKHAITQVYHLRQLYLPRERQNPLAHCGY